MINKTTIDWPGLTHTWNPVVGCEKNCTYCYARKMNNRFKWIPKWEKPQYFINRLPDPVKHKKPCKIFVGSMCDLFGEWIPRRWITDVIKIAEICEQHTFMLLTKNPKRYWEFNFPANCQLGATVTNYSDCERMVSGFTCKEDRYQFLSIEPLMGSMQGARLDWLDLVIVGADSSRGAIKPRREWIKSIKHPNIHYKANIKEYL